MADTNRGISLQQFKVLNAVAFIATIAINGLSSTGLLSQYEVGEVSDMNPTKITPAGGAFAIWGIIYSIEAFFVVYGFLGGLDGVLLHGVGFWFLLVCLFNSLWIVTFVQGNTASLWCSPLLIATLLVCLCKMYLGTECWQARRGGTFGQRCLQTLALDAHFSMYAGWVTVATIVNTSATLGSTGWDGAPLSDSAWTVILLVVALAINSYIVVTRQDCVWGWVLAWASFFIYVANKGDTAIVVGSLLVSGCSAAVSAVITARVVAQAWKDRGEMGESLGEEAESLA
jgi:hypothetical protein